MKMPKFHYQSNRKSSNANFVTKDLLKQMHRSIPIIEVATKKILFKRVLRKENSIEMKTDH